MDHQHVGTGPVLVALEGEGEAGIEPVRSPGTGTRRPVRTCSQRMPGVCPNSRQQKARTRRAF
ncbi:hypothetical protein, partial [Plasticicumulans sp.]|uniref:hypothetical protein n=1 Tax=Plasticicumulans sp. TaxID=2307179 RepID=UPI0032203A73